MIVNFWASWCGPCRDEFPLLQERLETLGESDGLVVVGVLYKDDAEPAMEFVTEFGASWQTVLDPTGAIADRYLIVAPPQSYFIDRAGIVRDRQIGEILAEDFDRIYPKIRGQS